MATKEPSIEALTDGAIAIIEKDLNTKIANRKGFIFTMLSATAGLAKICLKYGRAIFKNNFIHLADYEGLQKHAKEYGVILNKARPAHILVEVSEVNLKTVPIATTFILENLKFSSIENADLKDKKTLINAVSQKSRFFENLKIEQPLDIEEMLDLNQKAKIVKIFDVGANEETVEEFRKRLLGIKRNFGATGTQPYYVRNALKIYGVQDAMVFRGNELAQVTIYPVMHGDLAPSEEDKKRIVTHLNSAKVAILGDYVTVGNFKIVKVKVHINGLAPSTTIIQERIEKSIKNFLKSRKPIQHHLEDNQISYITTVDMYQILKEEGCRKGLITLTFDKEENRDYALKSPAIEENGFESFPEIAILEEITFD